MLPEKEAGLTSPIRDKHILWNVDYMCVCRPRPYNSQGLFWEKRKFKALWQISWPRLAAALNDHSFGGCGSAINPVQGKLLGSPFLAVRRDYSCAQPDIAETEKSSLAGPRSFSRAFGGFICAFSHFVQQTSKDYQNEGEESEKASRNGRPSSGFILEKLMKYVITLIMCILGAFCFLCSMLAVKHGVEFGKSRFLCFSALFLILGLIIAYFIANQIILSRVLHFRRELLVLDVRRGYELEHSIAEKIGVLAIVKAKLELI